MRVIVSDTSCIIDLRKGALLDELLALPYEVIIPQPLFENELLCLSQAQKKRLTKNGLQVMALSGEEVGAAQLIYNEHAQLTLYDGFALVVAEKTEGAIFLTGDRALREVSIVRNIETHGVLWATDQMFEHKCCGAKKLRDAIQVFLDDPLVFIADELLRPRLKRYR